MHELGLGFLLLVALPSILLVLGPIVLATAEGRRFYEAWFRRSAIVVIVSGSPEVLLHSSSASCAGAHDLLGSR